MTAQDTTARRPAPRSVRLGSIALTSAIFAIVLSCAISIAHASVQQNKNAMAEAYFSSGGGMYDVAMLLLGGSQLLWSLLGIAGLVCGIIAVVLSRGRARGIAAIVIGAVAPFLSYGIYAALR